MRVAIITDTHWGARNDSLAFIDYFDKFYTNVFIPKLIEEKIDTVLMLGDTFDRRKYTNHVSLSHAKRIYFEPLERLGIKIHMIVGNHDTAYRDWETDRKSTRLNSSHSRASRMPSSA